MVAVDDSAAAVPVLCCVLQATSEEALEALLQQCEGMQLPRLLTPRSKGYLSTASAAVEAAGGANSSSSSSSSSSNELLQKLYKHKLEALLKEHNTTLLRCKACQQLFSAASHHKLQCPALAEVATERWVHERGLSCIAG
jgi:CelD/BcsL family acetyltransferase involved in cellulose biosynthesis